MKISRDQKLKNASELIKQIYDCKTEDDLEQVDDMLEESAMAGLIFKKAYKFLSEELDGQISYLVEKGFI